MRRSVQLTLRPSLLKIAFRASGIACADGSFWLLRPQAALDEAILAD